MGYMGLDKNNWFSDGGLDLKYEIEESKPNRIQLNKLITKELKDKGNDYNPDGATHVSLLIEDKIINKNLLNKSIIKELILKMNKNVQNASTKNCWGIDNEDSRKTHYKWFLRLLKVVKK